VRLSAVPGQQPRNVWAAAGSLLAGDPKLLHKVLFAVGRGHVHRRVEPLHEVPRVALVPRGGEHDHKLSVGRELDELLRHGERVEEQQVLAVVVRIGRHLSAPRLVRRPVRVGCLPVPEATL
jgi:hypothetical protein